jgi:hypothetical protein
MYACLSTANVAKMRPPRVQQLNEMLLYQHSANANAAYVRELID